MGFEYWKFARVSIYAAIGASFLFAFLKPADREKGQFIPFPDNPRQEIPEGDFPTPRRYDVLPEPFPKLEERNENDDSEDRLRLKPKQRERDFYNPDNPFDREEVQYASSFSRFHWPRSSALGLLQRTDYA
jgi:hypothetical protein